jgi:hypothetical protein
LTKRCNKRNGKYHRRKEGRRWNYEGDKEKEERVRDKNTKEIIPC